MGQCQSSSAVATPTPSTELDAKKESPYAAKKELPPMSERIPIGMKQSQMASPCETASIETGEDTTDYGEEQQIMKDITDYGEERQMMNLTSWGTMDLPELQAMIKQDSKQSSCSAAWSQDPAPS